MKRLMISACGSGSGKTVLTCGLLRALSLRRMSVEAFKCGPDYIDPMFHTRVLGVPSRNLDRFLQGEMGLRRTLGGQRAEIALLEGAMGFYDGVNGRSEASAWQVAAETGTPVILAVRPGGSSVTLAAQIQGVLHFREPSMIRGLILTDCRESLADHLRPVLERETGIPVLGGLPKLAEAKLPSRHLGLVTAGEIADLAERFDRIAEELERHVDLQEVLKLAEAGEGDGRDEVSAGFGREKAEVCRIAVARDPAFCFYYQDNLEALEAAGARLIPFSPMADPELPEAEGLYLGGGYPELFLSELSANQSMRESIRGAVSGGMPTVAECGGFLYLQGSMRDTEGRSWTLAGALPGESFPTGRLQRFGYLWLAAPADSLLFRAGERIPAHEFHHWDSTENGTALRAEKPDGRSWNCGVVSENLYAAFPHLHWGGELPMAKRFVEKAAAWGQTRR